MTVEEGTTGNIIVRRSDTDVFCYYCFYFITVKPHVGEGEVKYDFEVTNSRDSGEEAELLDINRDKADL